MNIPFYPNTGDGTHCLQAALMMALAVLIPGRKFDHDELDRISAKEPGKWTWPTTAMLWMMNEGIEVKLIEEFDYADFATRGLEYLTDRFGVEVAKAQSENSDIVREQKVAKEFAAIAPVENRVPDIEDIKKLIAEKYVVIVNINSAALNQAPGYSGHFVVIVDVGGSTVTLHDPGLPPRPGFQVTREIFERAWAYPAPRDKNLMALRKTSLK